MKKVKLFGPEKSSQTLQQNIDAWIQDEKPSIINADTAGCGGNGYGVYFIITIVYTDNVNNINKQ